MVLSSVVMTFSFGQSGTKKISYKQYIKESAVPKSVLDTFLNQFSWAKFDPELGYVLGNYMPHDGMDNSSTISTTQSNGARTAHLYVDKPCRINTYGNSFTQCHQVNDGETWQEYLAAHLGEPVRNFGMGGYGVYQAYRRMVREEQTKDSAEYVILYIWGDDHMRSLLRCRYETYSRSFNFDGGRMFHGNFWCNVEMNLSTGKFVEKNSLLPTPQSLYKMTDPDWLYENLKDDLALQMVLYSNGNINDINKKEIEKLSKWLKVDIDLNDTSKLQQSVSKLLDKYSLEATKYILMKAKDFTDKNNKKLMIVLFDPYRVLKGMIKGLPRFDQEIVDFLKENKFNFFDMNIVHVNDFKKYNLSFDEYWKIYFIGHYNPIGNHFFAYSIKDQIVEWLDPKPIGYRNKQDRMIDFKGYLPN